MSATITFCLMVLIVLILFSLACFNAALKGLQKREGVRYLHPIGRGIFYRWFRETTLHRRAFDKFLFINDLARHILEFIYTLLASWSILVLSHFLQSPEEFNYFHAILLFLLYFSLLFCVGDYLPKVLGSHYLVTSFKFSAPLSSIFMAMVYPLAYFPVKLCEAFSKTIYFNPFAETVDGAKDELIEMIQESDFNSQHDPHNLKLIESIVDFKDRIAREVMVPRVNVFSLPSDTTIQNAALVLQNEGYSRTPVYKETLDNIVGVLMYKDVLTKYMESNRKGDPSILEAPIASLVKQVLYTPETKKLSQLLQEFRKKQVHLAIIVDEYGGTEGIVTIEDILEEIVGDIADEYDEEEKSPYIALPEGGWLVNAQMSIWDAEENFGIDIPQEGDYDTLGGYLFHASGTIPAKGFILRQKNFEIEVIRSNNRIVEKLRIKLIPNTQESEK